MRHKCCPFLYHRCLRHWDFSVLAVFLYCPDGAVRQRPPHSLKSCTGKDSPKAEGEGHLLWSMKVGTVHPVVCIGGSSPRTAREGRDSWMGRNRSLWILIFFLLWVYESFPFINVFKKQAPPLRLNVTDSGVGESISLWNTTSCHGDALKLPFMSSLSFLLPVAYVKLWREP